MTLRLSLASVLLALADKAQSLVVCAPNALWVRAQNLADHVTTVQPVTQQPLVDHVLHVQQVPSLRKVEIVLSAQPVHSPRADHHVASRAHPDSLPQKDPMVVHHVHLVQNLSLAVNVKPCVPMVVHGAQCYVCACCVHTTQSQDHQQQVVLVAH